MRRKIIAGGGVIVKSERQVAADSARWSGNRKRAFSKLGYNSIDILLSPVSSPEPNLAQVIFGVLRHV